MNITSILEIQNCRYVGIAGFGTVKKYD